MVNKDSHLRIFLQFQGLSINILVHPLATKIQIHSHWVQSINSNNWRFLKYIWELSEIVGSRSSSCFVERNRSKPKGEGLFFFSWFTSTCMHVNYTLFSPFFGKSLHTHTHRLQMFFFASASAEGLEYVVSSCYLCEHIN